MVLLIVFLRWSPVLLPYHVFGGKVEPTDLDMKGWMWFYGLLLFEWAVPTAAALETHCVFCIFMEAFLRIAIISQALGLAAQ